MLLPLHLQFVKFACSVQLATRLALTVATLARLFHCQRHKANWQTSSAACGLTQAGRGRRGKRWSIVAGQLLLLLLFISNRSYASLCDQALQIVCESELTVPVCLRVCVCLGLSLCVSCV